MSSFSNLSKVFKIYLSIVIVSFFLFLVCYFFFPDWAKQTNINNALSLITSLVQSEAAILGIVITLSLVAVQLTASSFSSRVISIFKNSSTLWIILLIYISTIIYSLCVLKFLNPINNFSNHEFGIWLALILGIYSFLALIPYTLDILDLMKPSTILGILAKKITKDNIQSSIEKKDDKDPIQPLMDILLTSLMRYDYGTLREGLDKLGSSINDMFKEEFKVHEEIFSNHIFDQLFIIAGLSKKISRDKASILKLIDILKENGSAAANQQLETTSLKAVSSLRIIGENTAEEKLESITIKVIKSLNKIAIVALNKKLKKLAPQSVLFLKDIGLLSAKKRLRKASKLVIYSLEEIGLKSVEKGHKKVSGLVITSLQKVGMAIAKQNDLEQQTRQVILSIEKVGKKAVEKKYKNTVLRAISSLRKLCLSKEEKPKKTTKQIISSIHLVGKKAAQKTISEATKSSVIALIFVGKELNEKNEKLRKLIIYSIEDVLQYEEKAINFPEELMIELKELFILTKDKLDFDTDNIEDIIE